MWRASILSLAGIAIFFLGRSTAPHEVMPLTSPQRVVVREVWRPSPAQLREVAHDPPQPPCAAPAVVATAPASDDAAPTPEQEAAANKARQLLAAANASGAWREADAEALRELLGSMSDEQRGHTMQALARAINAQQLQ